MRYKLVCFDMDGVLIDIPEYIWTELHNAFGVPKQYQRRQWKLYQSKQITYKEWVDSDIKQWINLGITKKDFEKSIRAMKLTEGTAETIQELKERGYTLAIVSGSLSIVIDILFPEHDFSDILINKITFDEQGRIASWEPTQYDWERKLQGIQMIAKKEKLNLKQVAFVGDSTNDIEAARQTGFSIAFNPKSKELESVCNVVIKKKDLREILQYL
ncbi:MAG: HAD-IB family phosphatase [Candidatus Woesearchaeota archaeon]